MVISRKGRTRISRLLDSMIGGPPFHPFLLLLCVLGDLLVTLPSCWRGREVDRRAQKSPRRRRGRERARSFLRRVELAERSHRNPFHILARIAGGRTEG